MKQIEFEVVKEHILEKLKSELSPLLYYHGIEHTKKVIKEVEEIGRLEGVNKEEIILLKTAALYHDIGFLERYEENEAIGTRIAKETLPDFGYDEQQIQVISDIIMATKLPQKPKNKLQEIICDADLGNLGSEEFFELNHKLRKEIIEYQSKELSLKDWYVTTLKFLEEHSYFTTSAIKLKQVKKEENIKKLKKLIEKRN